MPEGEGFAEKKLRMLTDDSAWGAMGMPCVVLCGRDSDATLSAAKAIVAASVPDVPGVHGVAPFGGPREPEDVALPRGGCGAGRRVAVDRRYDARTGALLVAVPDPCASNMSAADSAAALAGTDEDAENGDARDEGGPAHAGAAHAARCAGVIEVCKEFAGQWGVDMRRRIAIVHLACRLPRQCQGALRKLAEDAHASTLFVLTCTRPAALDQGFASRAFFAPVRDPALSSSASGARRRGPASTPLDFLLRLMPPSDNPPSRTASCLVQDPAALVSACAEADYAVALVRARGGDVVAARAAAATLCSSWRVPPPVGHRKNSDMVEDSFYTKRF